MKIVVCIKQVPASSAVDIDPVNGTLIRDSSGAKMNPFDLVALETAIRLKEQYNAHITALSMGPPQAIKILKESYLLDADEGVLLTDRAFAGADVLATSYAISQAIKTLGEVDLIICGKQTTDGDTAQVGPATAELLNIPHAAWVSRIEKITGTGILVHQESDDERRAVIELPFPCLISVEKGICEVRLPSYKNGLKNKDKKVKTITLMDMKDKNPDNYGLFGSPTRVEKIFPPDHRKEQVVLEEGPDVGGKLYDLLKKAHVL
ncbi:electron transfer flavoprotein subunit beta/FixA family protein [Lacrimispora sp.]|uniref:electron transfer flavoprotein subunit beta/FixA family protein n=1 Tax=Lacrimispora sp. TaxID=2719234 RepID=UPI0028A2B9B5|nr:electron transfer flavoprotein subunit beta/FixA family protein [Lacrimispora sp.]